MTERYWFLKLNLLVASFMLVLTMMLKALYKETNKNCNKELFKTRFCNVVLFSRLRLAYIISLEWLRVIERLWILFYLYFIKSYNN